MAKLWADGLWAPGLWADTLWEGGGGVTGTIPHHLIIDREPAGTVSGALLFTQPRISMRDIDGNVVAGFDGIAQAIIAAGNAFILSGSTVEFIGGYADFMLIVDGAGDVQLAFLVNGYDGVIASNLLHFPEAESASRAHKRSM